MGRTSIAKQRKIERLRSRGHTWQEIAKKLRLTVRTIKKFESRFKKVENHYKNNGKNMLDASLEQLDEIWEITKKSE